MNNVGRTVLALGLCSVMTFTNPECFFQTGTGSIVVQAAEAQEASEASTAGADSGESESTTEETTQKEEETTQAGAKDSTTAGESYEEASEHKSTQEEETSEEKEEEDSTKKNKTSPEKKTGAKQSVISRKDAQIVVKTVQDIRRKKAGKDAPDGQDKTGTFLPKIYNDTRLAMKNNKEYIGKYVYFNQGDAAWNQNGYCIKRAGCGPTSMAVVITSLTGRWVTPLDTAIWGYEHGFYSSAGSAHEMIPAMAAAFGLTCKGVGTDIGQIRQALKAGCPVVALMGPGYFTRGGHFMVLVEIDENDCVTVADVGSRARSAYKYRLTDVVAQAKAAGAGGPFWMMSYNKKETMQKESRTIRSYTKEAIAKDFAHTFYMKASGNLPRTVKKEHGQKTAQKVISVLSMAYGDEGLLAKEKGDSPLAPTRKKEEVIWEKEPEEERGQESLAGKLRQDITRRQWEKRIPLTRIESYSRGTLER